MGRGSEGRSTPAATVGDGGAGCSSPAVLSGAAVVMGVGGGRNRERGEVRE